MNQSLSVEERLIVAVDPPKDRCSTNEASEYVATLSASLVGVGDIVIKVNSALRGNYPLLKTIKGLGFRTFADLKLSDIPATMERDALILRQYEPDFVTVLCSAGRDGLETVAQVFRGTKTEILGVTVLTSMNERDCRNIFNESDVAKVVTRHSDIAFKAGLGGLVCSTHEINLLKSMFVDKCTLNAVGIRPTGYRNAGNQKRIGTPTEALHAGATRIIVGSPITEASSPRTAVEKILEEISKALTD